MIYNICCYQSQIKQWYIYPTQENRLTNVHQQKKINVNFNLRILSPRDLNEYIFCFSFLNFFHIVRGL